MNENKIKIVLGDAEPQGKIVEAYNPVVCDFLNDLSKWLRHDNEARLYEDLMTVGFWCRKSNIEKLKNEFEDGKLHMGRGLLFHIAPSNVPVNFAFSWFFGLLSGNSNIVRISSKNYPQVEILCRGIKEVLQDEKYVSIKEMTQFISYERDKETNDYYSGICNGRIIWGGDKTIESIRESKMKAKAVEIVFADRYSFGVIDSKKILEGATEDIKNLAKNFYNDTYLMDQNACSTPHLIMWLGEKWEDASKIFWEAVYEEAKRYDLQDIKVMDKYTELCSFAMETTDENHIKRYDNLLYVTEMSQLPENIENLRGRFGAYFECKIDSLEDIYNVVTEKSQSMMYYGLDKESLKEFIINGRMKGIDRVVPFGKALDMGVIWDGYDIVRNLSRTVSIEE